MKNESSDVCINKKICTKCTLEKETIEFTKGRNQCKKCRKEFIKQYQKNYKENNPEKVKNSQKKWCDNNKEKIKKYQKENTEISKKSNKKWNDNNNNKVKEISRNYYINNKEKVINYNKEYDIKNKEKINLRKNKYYKNRRETDSIYKLKISIRNLIRDKIKNGGFTKKSKTNEILGCSYIDFKNHLESKFEYWMNFENYGKYNGELNYGWDIDHIIPSSSAISEEEIIKLNHFSNLQPLCSKINRDIKKDKMTL
jgi:hypothetical protein